MGRTNPTYRTWLEGLEAEWQPFRRALRCRHQADFDRLFEKARQHADAAGFANPRDPLEGLVLGVLLAQERDLRELEARVAALESTDEVTGADEVSGGERPGGGARGAED